MRNKKRVNLKEKNSRRKGREEVEGKSIIRNNVTDEREINKERREKNRAKKRKREKEKCDKESFSKKNRADN